MVSFAAWDINPNPGPNNSNVQNPERNTYGTGINLSRNGINIGQWSVNNLTDVKFEQIKMLLNSGKQQIDVLFLLETFLKSKTPDSLLEIAGYTLYRKDRCGVKKGGGIFVYIINNLKVERLYDLEENELEAICLQICLFKSKRPLLIGGIYHPPSVTLDVDSNLEMNIETAYPKNLEMHIVGDFNINFLNSAYKQHRLVKALKSLNLTQLVNYVTRPASSTCLDHVYTTHPNLIVDISVPNMGLSDHLPVFFRRKYLKKFKEFEHVAIKYRDFKKLNVDNLIHSLEELPWDTAFVFDEIDEILDKLENLLNNILNQHIPIKEKQVKRQSQPAWMTREVLQWIRDQDKLLKQAQKSNLPGKWAQVKHARCKATNLIRKTKRYYFCDKTKEIPKAFGKQSDP